MRNLKLSAVVLSLSSMLWACGGGSGTDRSKLLTELSAQEVESICQESFDMYAAHMGQESVCKLVSIMMIAFGSPDQCDSMYTQCMAAPFDPEATASECDLSQQIPEDCQATVGEFLQCEEEALIVLADFLGGITCSSSMEDLSAMETMDQDIQSCLDFAEKCPGLITND